MSMRVAFGAVAALILGACTTTSLEARCAQGTFVQSASSCDALANHARSARLRLWTCADLTSDGCGDALATLWAESDDDAEVARALGLSQRACEAGRAGACRLASAAAWYGRGTPVDPVASWQWHRRCGAACERFAPEAGAPGAGSRWRELTSAARLERIARLAAASAHAAVIEVVDASRRAGRLSPDEVRQALAATIEARWRAEVAPLLAAGPTVQALAAADALVKLDDAPALTARRDDLRRGLAERELRAMDDARAAGLPFVTRFRALRAQRFGAAVDVPPEDIGAWSQLPTRLAITGVDATCGALARALDDAYPVSAANVTLTASLACKSEPTTHQVTERYTEPEEYDASYTHMVPIRCVNPETYSGCQYGSKTTTVRATRYVERERQVTRPTTRLVVTGTITGPIGSVRVRASSLDEDERDRQRDVFGQVDAQLRGLIASVRAAQAARELAAARVAVTPLEAEEHQLRAVSLGATDADPTQRLDAYQAQAPQLTAVDVVPPAPHPIAATFDLGAFHEPTRDADEEDARWPRRLARLDRLQLSFDYARRTADGRADGTGLGGRLTRTFRIGRARHVTWGFELGGGADDTYGSYFDAQAGGAVGARLGPLHYMYELGLGAMGMGDTMDHALEARGDLFHGPEVQLHLGRVLVGGRAWFLYGGALGDERRGSVELAYAFTRVSVLGVELTRRSFDDLDVTVWSVMFRFLDGRARGK